MYCCSSLWRRYGGTRFRHSQPRLSILLDIVVACLYVFIIKQAFSVHYSNESLLFWKMCMRVFVAQNRRQFYPIINIIFCKFAAQWCDYIVENFLLNIVRFCYILCVTIFCSFLCPLNPINYFGPVWWSRLKCHLLVQQKSMNVWPRNSGTYTHTHTHWMISVAFWFSTRRGCLNCHNDSHVIALVFNCLSLYRPFGKISCR